MRAVFLILLFLNATVALGGAGLYPKMQDSILKRTGCPNNNNPPICAADPNGPYKDASEDFLEIFDYLLRGTFPVDFDLSHWYPTPRTLSEFIWHLKYNKTAEEILWPWKDMTLSGTEKWENVKDVIMFQLYRKYSSQDITWDHVDTTLSGTDKWSSLKDVMMFQLYRQYPTEAITWDHVDSTLSGTDRWANLKDVMMFQLYRKYMPEDIGWDHVDITLSGTERWQNLKDVMMFQLYRQYGAEHIKFNYTNQVFFGTENPQNVEAVLINLVSRLHDAENKIETLETDYTALEARVAALEGP